MLDKRPNDKFPTKKVQGHTQMRCVLVEGRHDTRQDTAALFSPPTFLHVIHSKSRPRACALEAASPTQSVGASLRKL